MLSEQEDAWVHDLGLTSARPVPDVQIADIPLAPGAYALWGNTGSLIYVGLAGVRWSTDRPSATSTLRQRLRDHLSAHRADVLTSYLFERVAVMGFTSQQASDMLDGRLTIRNLVLEALATMSISWTSTQDYRTAKIIEDSCRAGALGQMPLINPLDSHP